MRQASAAALRLCRIFRVAREQAPRRTIALLGLTLLAGVLPFVASWVGKLIIDALVSMHVHPGTTDSGRRWISLLVGIEFLIVATLLCFDEVIGVLRYAVGARIALALNTEILRKLATLKQELFEDSEVHQNLVAARRGVTSRPVALIEDTAGLCKGVVVLTVAALFLLQVGVEIFAVFLAAVIPILWVELYFYSSRRDKTRADREVEYLGGVLTNDRYIKELRTYGAYDFLCGRFLRGAAAQTVDETRKLARRCRTSVALLLASSAALYFSFWLIAMRAVDGRITLGEMAFYMIVFRQGRKTFFTVGDRIRGIRESNAYLKQVMHLLDLDVRFRAPGPGSIRQEKGIRLENIGFRYQSSTRWSLRNVSLFVPAGRSLAVVGANGSGKSTLMKVIAGIYEPLEGRLLFDGVPVQSISPEHLARRLSVLFQDFGRYQLSFGDNVAFGAEAPDLDQLRAAASAAGAEELLSRLPDSHRSKLGRAADRGIELSGGEWQKVALARALYRSQADIFLWDEPASALDPRSEEVLWRNFESMKAGRIVVIVTHRLASAMRCDNIVVLKDGLVMEEGPHCDLLARGGTYAGLWAAQDRRGGVPRQPDEISANVGKT